MKKKILRSIVLILSISLLSFGYVHPSIEKVYANYVSATESTLDNTVAKWSFKVNNQSQSSILIELKDTIITNNYSMTKVIPGTKGRIDFDIDFSDTQVSTKYQIIPVTANNVLPANLKLYTDAEMTEELTSITGTVALQDVDTVISKTIYWQWVFTDTDESSWANEDLVLELALIGTQNIVEGP